MIEDHRPLIDDLTSSGQELIDTYPLEDRQTVQNDVTQLTSKYDEVKHATRDKLRLLNEALRHTVTEVSC